MITSYEMFFFFFYIKDHKQDIIAARYQSVRISAEGYVACTWTGHRFGAW